jgi:hypothetical protein
MLLATQAEVEEHRTQNIPYREGLARGYQGKRTGPGHGRAVKSATAASGRSVLMVNTPGGQVLEYVKDRIVVKNNR